MFRGQETRKCLPQHGTSTSYLCSQRLETMVEEGAEKTVRTRNSRRSYGETFSGHNGTGAGMNQHWLHAKDLQKNQTRQQNPTRTGGVRKSHTKLTNRSYWLLGIGQSIFLNNVVPRNLSTIQYTVLHQYICYNAKQGPVA